MNGSGTPGHGHQSHRDHEIAERLRGQHRHDAERDQSAKRFACSRGDFGAGEEEREIRQQHDCCAEEAELLADQCEHHVVVRFRDVFADGNLTDALAHNATGAERDQGPVLLITAMLHRVLIATQDVQYVPPLIAADQLREMRQYRQMRMWFARLIFS